MKREARVLLVRRCEPGVLVAVVLRGDSRVEHVAASTTLDGLLEALGSVVEEVRFTNDPGVSERLGVDMSPGGLGPCSSCIDELVDALCGIAGSLARQSL